MRRLIESALAAVVGVEDRFRGLASPAATPAVGRVQFEARSPPMVIERTTSWLLRFKRLGLRYDRTKCTPAPILTLGMALIIFAGSSRPSVGTRSEGGELALGELLVFYSDGLAERDGRARSVGLVELAESPATPPRVARCRRAPPPPLQSGSPVSPSSY